MVEPITATAPRSIGRTLLTQSWLDVTMLHWPVDPDEVQRLIPAGTSRDLLDGTTYVGLIGFRMSRLSLGPRPPLPYLGSFLETNVRLYTVDGQGRRGVFFCTLDASRLLPVIGGQVGARVNYVWARMRFDREPDAAGDVLRYSFRRRWPDRRTRGAMAVRIGARVAEPTPLQSFLTSRWGLHTRWYGRTVYLPNEHPEWPLHEADLLALQEDPVNGPVARAGLSVSGPPVSVVYSPGVAVRFGPPQ